MPGHCRGQNPRHAKSSWRRAPQCLTDNSGGTGRWFGTSQTRSREHTHCIRHKCKTQQWTDESETFLLKQGYLNWWSVLAPSICRDSIFRKLLGGSILRLGSGGKIVEGVWKGLYLKNGDGVVAWMVKWEVVMGKVVVVRVAMEDLVMEDLTKREVAMLLSPRRQ